MNKSIVLAFFLAVAAALWVASGEFTSSSRTASVAAPAEAPLPEVRVQVSQALPRAEAIAVLGRTEPSRAVVVRAETEGHVAEILAAEGAGIAAGEPIARLAEDDRPARLAEARARLEQRTIELDAALTLMSQGYQTEVRTAEMAADAKEAEAELAAIELDLARTSLRAPFDGVVERRDVEVGDFVRVGDAVAYVVDLDPILVAAEITERDAGRFVVGESAVARLITGQTVEGRIRYIGRVADPATHTFRVELEVANPRGAIAAGVTAELELATDAVAAHLLSPAVLTLADDGTVGVKTVEADGLVAFHPVALVGDGPEGVWITGLAPSATVIVVGQEYVSAGQRVTAVAAP